MIGEKRSRLALPLKEYKKFLRQIFKRDGWKCRCCGRRDDLHGHHIVFRSQGGDDAEWNVITLCNHCHDAVHDPVHIIIRAFDDDAEYIDANERVEFEFINGWLPPRIRGTRRRVA